MKRVMHILCALMLILVCVSALSGISFGAQESTAPEAPSDTQQIMITVPFPDFSETLAFEWDFPYSDSYFLEPSDTFSRELAKATMGLTVSAFRNNKGVMDNQYATYLEGAGFRMFMRSDMIRRHRRIPFPG